MFDRIKAKEKSKTLLRTRSFLDTLGFVLIITTISVAGILFSIPIFQAVLSYFAVTSILGSSPSAISAIIISTLIISLTIGFVLVVIFLLFKAGMNRAALRMNRGDKNVRVLDVILAGDMLGRYIAITLWQVLYHFLWSLPSIGAYILASIIALKNIGSSTAAAFAVILVITAWIWDIYININKYCQYYFAYCVADDNREIAALDCIRESSNLMVDYKWDLFVTMLSFLGWDIIASLPYGSVFVTPYKYLTYTSIYEQLIGNFKPIARSHMQWLHNNPLSSKDETDSGERGVEILSGEFAGASITVKSGEDITIGRDPKRANIVTSSSNTSISGLHCRIRYDEQSGKYIVIDHSSNGTYLNNEKLIPEKPTYAAKGSLVKLADGAMILRLS